MERIVVGVDESEPASEAVRWAVREGAVRGWPVTAVLAWSVLEQHHVLVEGFEDFDPHYDGAKAAEALSTYVERAVGADAAANIEPAVVCDRPAPGLLEAAEGASLLVVGARGLGGFRGLLLGSVSQAVLHHSKVPVAIVRPTTGAADTSGGRVVVGVDGSDTSRRALQWAADEARARGGRLTVVHCWSSPNYYGSPYALAIDPAPLEEGARALVDEMIAGCDASGLPKAPERIVAQGAPTAATILECAKDADLVVVGARGVGGFRGLLLGSVSHQVAHHATCPVVVIPSAEE